MSFDPSQLFLKQLFVKSFRNLAEEHLTFSPGHTLLVGHNGHGKTNYLEAIALACSLKPMQALHNIDLIQFSDVQAKIMASFEGAQKIEMDIHILPHGKKAKLNHHPLKNASGLHRLVSLVTFIPAELALITGPSSLRRRALDQAAAALFFEQVTALKNYERLMLHRNKLLKDWPIDHETLASFTQLMITEGAQVIFGRLRAIACMSSAFQEKMSAMLGRDCSASLRYQMRDRELSQCNVPDLIALLNDEKARVAELEKKRRVSLFGPHLDDVMFCINGQNAKTSASRGQSRALIISFKLAHMLAIQSIRGNPPIVILDDIVSELDEVTKANLYQVISDLKTQAFFSTTDQKTFGNLSSINEVFLVNEGRIARESI